MKVSSIRNLMFLFVLVGLSFAAAACGSGGGEGKYRDPSGQINAEFKDGKATSRSAATRSAARTKLRATRSSRGAISVP